MEGTSWALVSITAVLVIITGWYATEMRRTVRRMDREYEGRFRPILTFQLIPWRPNLLKLRIQNVGYGPAVDIKGTIESIIHSGSASFSWSYPLLVAGKYEEFGFPMPDDASKEARFNLDAIRHNVKEVRAQLTYNSISGKQYELQDSIQIGEITNSWAKSRMMVTQDHPERIIQRIAEALETIARK